MVNMHTVQSSSITAIGYSEDTSQLFVEFKGGKLISCKPVSVIEFNKLLKADSIVSHFSKFIKGNEFEKVTFEEKASKPTIDTIQKTEHEADYVELLKIQAKKIAKQQKEIEALKQELKIQMEAPMQPIINGRFKSNKIVEHLLDSGGINLNMLAAIDFPENDKMQFAQLIGYSVGGYSTLSYVSDESYFRAEKQL